MWKKLLLSALALGLAAAANTQLCCSLRVDGQELAGLYAPGDADRARTAAAAAADGATAILPPPPGRSPALPKTAPRGRKGNSSWN